MKEFIIKNKKGVIVFLCSIAVIAVCGIIGSQLNKDDKDDINITFHDNTSIGDIGAVSYAEYDATELSSTETVSETVSDAASAVVSE